MCVLILLLLFSFPYFQEQSPVYRDREYWEKTGKIIWEVPTTKKVIALTFDDGPSPTFTPEILALLKEYEAKATFFIIGKQAEKFPEIVQQVAIAGHSIGNHMYVHQIIGKLPFEELRNDLWQAHQLLFQLSGTVPRFFRPPDGYYDEIIVEAAEVFDYKVVIWTWGQDSRDWSNISGKSIAQKIIKNVKPGDIILFHDQGGDRSNTIQALEIILPTLTKKGYEFVTLDEMLKNSTVEYENQI